MNGPALTSAPFPSAESALIFRVGAAGRELSVNLRCRLNAAPQNSLSVVCANSAVRNGLHLDVDLASANEIS